MKLVAILLSIVGAIIAAIGGLIDGVIAEQTISVFWAGVLSHESYLPFA